MPAITALAKEFSGRATIAKLDIDRLWVRDRNVVEQFKIHVLPMLILYRDGQEVARLVGADNTTPERLRVALRAALGEETAPPDAARATAEAESPAGT